MDGYSYDNPGRHVGHHFGRLHGRVHQITPIGPQAKWISRREQRPIDIVVTVEGFTTTDRMHMQRIGTRPPPEPRDQIPLTKVDNPDLLIRRFREGAFTYAPALAPSAPFATNVALRVDGAGAPVALFATSDSALRAARLTDDGWVLDTVSASAVPAEADLIFDPTGAPIAAFVEMGSDGVQDVVVMRLDQPPCE